MERTRRSRTARASWLFLITSGTAAATPAFTGNVPADFTDPTCITMTDPSGIDVGVPLVFGTGVISGNDVQDIRLHYDTLTDTLSVGFNTYVIAGDVDGDGNPSGTSSALASIGGTDVADFGGTESFVILFDLDEDGITDVTAGVSALTDLSGFSVARFTGSEYAPAFAFGSLLPSHVGSVYANPSSGAPDLEFTILNFSLLPTSSGGTGVDGFKVNAFVGSYSDAGIGEDFVPGTATFYPVCFDSDMDGVTTCDGDCDDSEADAAPGLSEVCDGIDNDCNGQSDEGFDSDNDGLADCVDTEECDGVDNDGDGQVDEGFDLDHDNYTTCQGDCNDTTAAINPGTPDLCNDIDDNCNGQVDEGLDSDHDGLADCYDTEVCDGQDNDGDTQIDEGFDGDHDGYTVCMGDCNDGSAGVNPGAQEVCNGADDNCNAEVDENLDSDQDGLANCYDTEECDGVDNDGDGAVDEGFNQDGDSLTTCGGDCDDSDPSILPGANERCNGKDDDCDGVIDDFPDPDGDGFTSCTGDCNESDANIHPGAEEICNFIDDDCTGLADDRDDLDGDFYTLCEGDCNDNDATINPGRQEVCNGKDDNCNTQVDEGFDSDVDGLADCFDTEECDGKDNDGDGQVDEGFDNDADGFSTCHLDCNDNNANVNPNAAEICDGQDNNCNGQVDEGLDSDGDGIADCQDQEECDNLDNDGDGQADEGLNCQDECPATDPGPCLSIAQAHALGVLQVSSNPGNNAMVDFKNTGSEPICFDERAIYFSTNTQSAFADVDVLNDAVEIPPGATFTIHYASWTTNNGVYQPYLGLYAWWCVEAGQLAAAGNSYDYFGEGVPSVLANFADNPSDTDGDNVEDHVDWASNYGTQAQHNIWGWQAIHPVLTAGKTADAVGSGAEVTLVSRNIGALAGAALLEDIVPAGWSFGSANLPATLTPQLDGSTVVSFDISVAAAGSPGELVTVIYNMAPNSGNDVPYIELAPATVTYFNGNDEEVNSSLTAPLYFVDGDGDGVAECAVSETCDGVDNDLDGATDEGFDSDSDGIANCFDTEECDGADNNGDGHVDEGFGDSDHDGTADCVDVEVCDGADNNGDGDIDEGFDADGDLATTCGGDCDDTNAGTNPGTPESCDNTDNNCDGQVDEGFDVDGDGVKTCGGDCDDSNANVNPGGTESCDNTDNDCDGQVDEGFDADGDGVKACGGDCDDTNANINPGATESCDNTDNDCDGQVDEGFDADGDGVKACGGDCDDTNANINPGATESCDNKDNDCDGQVDEGFDADGDGVKTCGGDCDDTNAWISPNATETCDNKDNDCDGLTDEGFDQDGDGVKTCGGDCKDNDASVKPGATEICDGKDNDCDTAVDEGFDQDGDGVTTCGGDCKDTDAGVKPGATETCDGKDNDCDGLTDEGFDQDGDGVTTCGGDCKDTDAGVKPGATESCDGKDNDCDGLTDEGFDADGDGVKTCGGDCNDNDGGIKPGATETCDGKDNDCDGTADEGGVCDTDPCDNDDDSDEDNDSDEDDDHDEGDSDEDCDHDEGDSDEDCDHDEGGSDEDCDHDEGGSDEDCDHDSDEDDDHDEGHSDEDCDHDSDEDDDHDEGSADEDCDHDSDEDDDHDEGDSDEDCDHDEGDSDEDCDHDDDSDEDSGDGCDDEEEPSNGGSDTCGNSHVDAPAFTAPACPNPSVITYVSSRSQLNTWLANPVTTVQIKSSMDLAGADLKLVTNCDVKVNSGIWLYNIDDVYISGRNITFSGSIDANGHVRMIGTNSVTTSNCTYIGEPVKSYVVEAPTVSDSAWVVYKDRYCAEANTLTTGNSGRESLGNGDATVYGGTTTINGYWEGGDLVDIKSWSGNLTVTADGAVVESGDVKLQSAAVLDFKGYLGEVGNVTMSSTGTTYLRDCAGIEGAGVVDITAGTTLDWAGAWIWSAGDTTVIAGGNITYQTYAYIGAVEDVIIRTPALIDYKGWIEEVNSILIETGTYNQRDNSGMTCSGPVTIKVSSTSQTQLSGYIQNNGNVSVTSPNLYLKQYGSIESNGNITVKSTGNYTQKGKLRYNKAVKINTGTYTLQSGYSLSSNQSCTITGGKTSGSSSLSGCKQG